MAKDDRLYAKFTLDFVDNPKIVCLSDAAFRAWFEMIMWSRTHLTDGFIPKQLIRQTPEARGLWLLDVCLELLRNDPVNPSLTEVENGYLLHDFTKHQTSRAEIEQRRDAKIRAGQLGGIASGKARRSKREAPSKQTRSKTNPETETETEIKEQEQKTCATALRDQTTASSSFTKFWEVYPRRRDKRNAQKAFTAALKRADADTIIAGAWRYANDPNREDRYTKYAQGWLNGDCWLDEPLPSRVNGNGAHPPPNKVRGYAELANRVRSSEQALESNRPKELE